MGTRPWIGGLFQSHAFSNSRRWCTIEAKILNWTFLLILVFELGLCSSSLEGCSSGSLSQQNLVIPSISRKVSFGRKRDQSRCYKKAQGIVFSCVTPGLCVRGGNVYSDKLPPPPPPPPLNVEINNRVKETKDPEYEEPESDESDQGSQTNHHDRNDQYYYEHPNNVQDPRRHAYGQQGYDPSRRFYNGQNSNDQHQMYHPNYSNVPYPRQGPPYGYEQQRNIPYSDQYYPQRGVPPEYQPTHYPHPQATDVRQDVSHRPPPAIPGTSVPSSDEINEPGDLDHDKAVGTVTDDKPVTENPAIDDAQPLNPQVPLTDGKVGLEDQLFAFAPGSTNERPVEMHLQSLDQTLIFEGLKRLYRKKILPLELSSKYGHFHSPPLSPSDFDARPMVLLLGQYRYAFLIIVQH